MPETNFGMSSVRRRSARNSDWSNMVQPVIQVFSESWTTFTIGTKSRCCRSNQPDIHLMCPITAESFEFLRSCSTRSNSA